ncbi:MAG: hypothetical protein V1765_00090 [bacterium]
MTLRSYLALMIFATIICALALATVLITVDPFFTNWLGFILFYAALFLTVTGVFAILGFVIRFVFLRQRLAVKAVVISFRQAFLTAFLIVACLLLASQNLFSWLNVLLLIIGFSTLEFLLISFSAENK